MDNKNAINFNCPDDPLWALYHWADQPKHPTTLAGAADGKAGKYNYTAHPFYTLQSQHCNKQIYADQIICAHELHYG